MSARATLSAQTQAVDRAVRRCCSHEKLPASQREHEEGLLREAARTLVWLERNRDRIHRAFGKTSVDGDGM